MDRWQHINALVQRVQAHEAKIEHKDKGQFIIAEVCQQQKRSEDEIGEDLTGMQQDVGMMVSKLGYTFAAVPWKMGKMEWMNKEIRKALYQEEYCVKTLATERLCFKQGKLGV